MRIIAKRSPAGFQNLMRTRQLIGILLCFLITGLTGCAKLTTPPPPDCGIPPDRMNKVLRIGYLESWNTFKTTDFLTAVVEVKEGTEVTAPYDFNLKVFVESPQDKLWHQTGNAVRFITPEYDEDHNLVFDLYQDDIRLQLLLTPESENECHLH